MMKLFKKYRDKRVVLEISGSFVLNKKTNEKVAKIIDDKIIFIKDLPEDKYCMINKAEC